MIDILKFHIERLLNRTLPENNYEFFSNLLFEKSFDKKDLIVEEGKQCNHIYFVTEGTCYLSITDEKGEEHAMQFALEGYWI